MTVTKLDKFLRGWFIGNFEPSLLNTKDFEIGVLRHSKDEKWKKHFHKIATEYNLLLSGNMTINDINLNSGDLFVIEPNEIADPVFHEDCVIVCCKVPSVIGDKYFVD